MTSSLQVETVFLVYNYMTRWSCKRSRQWNVFWGGRGGRICLKILYFLGKGNAFVLITNIVVFFVTANCVVTQLSSSLGKSVTQRCVTTQKTDCIGDYQHGCRGVSCKAAIETIYRISLFIHFIISYFMFQRNPFVLDSNPRLLTSVPEAVPALVAPY